MTSAIGDDSKIQSVRTAFKLIHANTGCALGETDKTLPKWYEFSLTFVPLSSYVLFF